MGPLAGVRVLEFAGMGPGPFCAMMLADMGADVLRIERPMSVGSKQEPYKYQVLNRGRSSMCLDLKTDRARAAALQLVRRADAIIEGFRPGVMESLGLGPERCRAVNPRLIYGRMTGWGQNGPLARRAGHDINYVALSGALWPIGRRGEKPVPPLNLVGDFGGGGMYLAFGIACALFEAQRSGEGQIVDAAMVDGAASLSTFLYGLKAEGRWSDHRGDNIIDTGAPWYEVYETKDGKFVSIGAIEPAFYRELLNRIGLESAELPAQYDQAGWPALRDRFEQVFLSRTRDEWVSAFDGSDACFAPVLSPEEAHADLHNKERGTFVEIDGIVQPAPAPRFSRTNPAKPIPPGAVGVGVVSCMRRWGFSEDDAHNLFEGRVVST